MVELLPLCMSWLKVWLCFTLLWVWLPVPKKMPTIEETLLGADMVLIYQGCNPGPIEFNGIYFSGASILSQVSLLQSLQTPKLHGYWLWVRQTYSTEMSACCEWQNIKEQTKNNPMELFGVIILHYLFLSNSKCRQTPYAAWGGTVFRSSYNL